MTVNVKFGGQCGRSCVTLRYYNKRNELASSCPHRNRFTLRTFRIENIDPVFFIYRNNGIPSCGTCLLGSIGFVNEGSVKVFYLDIQKVNSHSISKTERR